LLHVEFWAIIIGDRNSSDAANFLIFSVGLRYILLFRFVATVLKSEIRQKSAGTTLERVEEGK
jgi:hypothetical protein